MGHPSTHMLEDTHTEPKDHTSRTSASSTRTELITGDLLGHSRSLSTWASLPTWLGIKHWRWAGPRSRVQSPGWASRPGPYSSLSSSLLLSYLLLSPSQCSEESSSVAADAQVTRPAASVTHSASPPAPETHAVSGHQSGVRLTYGGYSLTRAVLPAWLGLHLSWTE